MIGIGSVKRGKSCTSGEGFESAVQVWLAGIANRLMQRRGPVDCRPITGEYVNVDEYARANQL
jgi:hypothetical protein